MPFLDPTHGDDRRLGLGPTPSQLLIHDELERRMPSFWTETLPTAFKRENTVGSLIDLWLFNRENKWMTDGFDVDLNFNPFDPDLIKGTVFEVVPSALLNVRNRRDFEFAKLKTERELEQIRIIEDSQYNAVGGMLLAGLIDPVNFLPVGVGAFERVVNLMRTGWRVAGSRVAKGALAGVVGNVYAEGVLYNNQEVRTLEQSALNISAGAVFGAMVGSVAAIPAVYKHRAMRDLHQLYGLPLRYVREKPKKIRTHFDDPAEPITSRDVNYAPHGTVIDPNRAWVGLDESFPFGRPGAEIPREGQPRRIFNWHWTSSREGRKPWNHDSRWDRSKPHTITMIHFSEIRRLIGSIPSIRQDFSQGPGKLPRPRFYVMRMNNRGGSPHAAMEMRIIGVEGMDTLAHLRSIDDLVNPEVPVEIVVVNPTKNQLQRLQTAFDRKSNPGPWKLHRYRFKKNKVPVTTSLGRLHSHPYSKEPTSLRLRRSITCNSPCRVYSHEDFATMGETIPGGLHEDGTVGISDEALKMDTTGAYNPDVRATESEIESALGVEKLIGQWFPGVRLATSPLLSIRQNINKLIDTGLRYKNHALGIPNSRSAESGIRRWYTILGHVLETQDQIYLQYRMDKGHVPLTTKQNVEIFRLDVADRLKGPPEGVLTKHQFYEEVGKAMRNGDNHSNASVAKAAKATREAHLEIYRAAVRVGIMDDFTHLDAEGNPVGAVYVGERATAASHFRRVYNKHRLAKPEERQAFIRAVAEDWIAYYHIRERYQIDEGQEIEFFLREQGIEDAELANLIRESVGFERGAEELVEDPVTHRMLTAMELRRQLFSEGKGSDQAEFLRRRGYTPEQLKLLEKRNRLIYGHMDAKRDKAAGEAADALPDEAMEFMRLVNEFRTGELAEHVKFRERQKIDETYEAAERVYDHIMSSPASRTPSAEIPGLEGIWHQGDLDQIRRPGSTRPRTLDVPDSVIQRWLEDDVQLVTRYLFRTMVPDIEIARNFGREIVNPETGEVRWMGDPDMRMALAKLQEDLDNEVAMRRARGDDEDSIIDFDNRGKKGIQDMANLRDVLRGQYAVPKNPEHGAYRFLRSIRAINYMTMGGGFMLSSIPDIARLVTVNGLSNAFDTAMKIWRLPAGARTGMLRELGYEARLSGVAWETLLNQRAMNVFDLSDDYGHGARAEMGIRAAADRFAMISLLSPWNDMMKRWSAIFTGQNMAETIVRLANRKGTIRDRELAAFWGFTPQVIRKMATEIEARGKEGRMWKLETPDWKDREAVDAFRLALGREVDRTIITPGAGDVPLFLNTEVGRTVFQFKRFAMASTKQILLSNLQYRDAQALNGILISTALGALVSQFKAEQFGYSINSTEELILSAMDRSGQWGVLPDLNNQLGLLSRGTLAPGQLIFGGHNRYKYTERGPADVVLGPTMGTLRNVGKVGSMLLKAGRGEPEQIMENEIRAAARLGTPYSLFYFTRMIDSVVQAASRPGLRARREQRLEKQREVTSSMRTSQIMNAGDYFQAEMNFEDGGVDEMFDWVRERYAVVTNDNLPLTRSQERAMRSRFTENNLAALKESADKKGIRGMVRYLSSLVEDVA